MDLYLADIKMNLLQIIKKEDIKKCKNKLITYNMKSIINRADIIGGLKSVELAKKNPQNYQAGVGVTEDFKLKDSKN